MSSIILLNGCSSSGKTLIVKAIQHLSPKPWLTLGIDTLFKAMPADYVGFGAKADLGIQFIPSKTKDDLPIMQIQTGPYGKQIVEAMPLMVKTLADAGLDILLDEVLLRDEFEGYKKSLENHRLYFIGVYCDLKDMEEREILREDRAWGLARDQMSKVHQSRNYDFRVDTTLSSPFVCAQMILDYIAENP